MSWGVSPLQGHVQHFIRPDAPVRQSGMAGRWYVRTACAREVSVSADYRLRLTVRPSPSPRLCPDCERRFA